MKDTGDSANGKSPKNLGASLVFLVLAIAGAVPMLIAINDPSALEYQPNGYGDPDFVFGLLCLIGVSIPTSLISLLLGLSARSRSRFSYVSIIPTSLFLAYCGYTYLQLRL